MMSMWREQVIAPADAWLGRDTPALAVDAFRILVGLLSSAFFVRLLVEFPEISHPEGLIDHRLTQDIYWYTRIGLFQPGMPGWLIASAYGVGLVGAGMITAGYRVRTGALLALVVAASAYRWNFVVMYLDDAVVHLMIFWMLLLPVGRTLTISGWRAGSEVRAGWADLRVPGTAVRCLLLNVCWIYLIAGAWKLDSVLWREGFGLYASMKVEVARMPDFWGPQHIPFLRWSDYLVMALEPILPIPMLLGPRSLRIGGAIAFLTFNLFILVTLGITWAIVGLTCTLALFLGEELAGLLGSRFAAGGKALAETSGAEAAARNPRGRAERFALVFVTVLAVATSRHIPGFGVLNEPAYGALWMVGVAQDYRLFNWIDRVAYQVRTDIDVWGPDGEPVSVSVEAYPGGFRAKLLQAYAHDVRWLLLPDDRRFDLRLSIVRRHASWFCRYVEEPGTRAEIISTIHPVRPDNVDLSFFVTLRLAEFECVPPGSVTVQEGGIPVPDGWPYLQARLIQGLNRLD